MQESEKKYRGMAESTLDPITTITQGYFAYLSPASPKIFDFRPEEMIGRHIEDFIPECNLAKANQAFKEGMNGKNVEGVVLEILRKDQSPHPQRLGLLPCLKLKMKNQWESMPLFKT